jgi:hypothetical protein
LLLLNSKVKSVRVGKELAVLFQLASILPQTQNKIHGWNAAYPPPISKQIGSGLAANLR